MRRGRNGWAAGRLLLGAGLGKGAGALTLHCPPIESCGAGGQRVWGAVELAVSLYPGGML